MPPPNPTHRFFVESALWHSSLGNLDLTLKALQRVAQINGKQKEGAKLSVEVRPPPKTLCDTPPGLLHLPPHSRIQVVWGFPGRGWREGSPGEAKC